MEASKWIHIQVLLDSEEMKQLFQELGFVHLFLIGEVVEKGNEEISLEKFLQRYQNYVSCLAEGKNPDPFQITLAITSTKTSVKTQEISNHQTIVQAVLPVIQLQMHRMGYSSVDQKFRPMILGKKSITWGVQLSYPQLFQQEGNPMKVDESEHFPNTILFRTLRRWIRKNSMPTPFIVDEKKINVPIRLGKMCFSWINQHPQLIEQQIRVI